MSIVLIKQYRKTDNQDKDNKTLQTEFTNNGVKTVVVPTDLSVEWVPVGPHQLAVIHLYGATKTLQNAADKLKADLERHHIKVIILPSDTSVEILPVS